VCKLCTNVLPTSIRPTDVPDLTLQVTADNSFSAKTVQKVYLFVDPSSVDYFQLYFLRKKLLAAAITGFYTASLKVAEHQPIHPTEIE
jgi:hypothetical protein